MTIIEAKVTDQLLTITKDPIVASGGINETSIHFSFDARWDGFIKTAVFADAKKENWYSVSMDSNNTAVVPAQVTLEKGRFWIGVMGVKGEIRYTTRIASYNVEEGVILSVEAGGIPQSVIDRVAAKVSTYVASELAKRGQVKPEFANSIEECTDTSKLYVLPDGLIYAYIRRFIPGGVNYTNLVPTSIDTDGTIYNGTGYKENVRLSSSGGVSSAAQNGSVTTGFIEYTYEAPFIIRIKGATWVGESQLNSGTHWYLHFYDSNKNHLREIISGGLPESGIYVGIIEHEEIPQAHISYDENTGVTTFDFSYCETYTADIANAIKKGKYLRLNAKGKGADLAVTVNQEIEESVPTETYQWLSTGHAFVPADYEDRIVDLEAEATENKETVAGLKQQVKNIVDGTTEIAASTKFDPTAYNLPILSLTGDVSPIAISKDNTVTLNYSYQDREGTCTLKGQGATSYKIAKELVDNGRAGKFNYTIKFDNAFEAAAGWGAQKKYCLKANWIDHTHSRNVVSAKIWGLMVKSRKTANANLVNLVNGGAVDGFPIVIMLNNEFHGLYTFNIPKDGWMFGLKEDATKQQAFVGANDHELATQFKGELAGDESDFELEFVSDEDNAGWVTESLNRLINACINSTGNDLDTTVAKYLDWDSAIDYYIWTVVCQGTDMVDKNYLLTTFDGTKWCFTAYDMDSTFFKGYARTRSFQF